MAKPLHRLSPRTDDRLFVRDGFRSFRKTYAMTEVGWGAVTAAGLVAVVAWVIWRGAHPDPELFDVSAALEMGESTASSADRGPLPEGLTLAGWSEQSVAAFGADNLYEKINGRAGFFKSFGVQGMVAATLLRDDDPAVALDIELYDLGEAKNALGAYNGERPAEIPAVESDSAMQHFDRNAAFLTKGQYYARLIGSEESARNTSLLNHLLSLLKRELPSEQLPWGYELLATHLGVDNSQVAYTKENAFSFGFASNVYTATVSPLDADVDAMVFVTPAKDPSAAAELAVKFNQGFESIGSQVRAEGDVWVKNDFVGTFATAVATEQWVIGIKGVANVADGKQWLEKLTNAIAAFEEAGGQAELPSATSLSELKEGESQELPAVNNAEPEAVSNPESEDEY